jgi:hypothetical protein
MKRIANEEIQLISKLAVQHMLTRDSQHTNLQGKITRINSYAQLLRGS